MKHLVCPTCRSRIAVEDADLARAIRCPACDELYPSETADAVEVIEAEPRGVKSSAKASRRPTRSRGWIMAAAAALVLFAGCGICVGVGGIAGGYLWNRWPKGEAQPIAQNPVPNKDEKLPPVEKPDANDKPAMDLPVDAPPKIPADVPAIPPAKWLSPLAGNADKADVVSYSLDFPVLRNADIYFTDGPRRRIGCFGTIDRGKPLTHRFYLFDPETKQTLSSRIPYATFSPCRRGLSPDGKFVASDVRVGGAGITLRVSIWQVGSDEQAVKEWGLPASPGNRKGLLRNWFFVGNDQLLTVTLAGLFEWWQVPEMKQIKQYQAPGKSLYSVIVLARDRRRCALYDRNHFRIIDIEKGEPICETSVLTPVPGKPSVYPSALSTAFSGDGSKLATVIHNATAEPSIFCYETTTGKQIGPPVTLHQKKFAQHNLGWLGPRHLLLYDRFLGGPVGLYRVGDAGHCAVLSGPPRKVNVALQAPDDLLWYVSAAEPGKRASRLVGTPLPPSLQMATAVRPVQMTLGRQGLVENAGFPGHD